MIRVLLVDDHPIVRAGLKSLLSRYDDTLVAAEAGSSLEAMEMLVIHKPDVMILDIQMEKPTFTLASEAKLKVPDIRVLFITAFDSLANLESVKKHGGDGLVSKNEGIRRIYQGLCAVAQGGDFFPEPRSMDGIQLRSVKDSLGPINHPLSPREVDILCCVAQAMTAKQIARDLHISVKTVDRHKANIMDKLCMRSQIELTRYAIRYGFVRL